MTATEPRAAPAAVIREPFVGPRPFEREEEEFFFGRDREAEDLVSLVIANRVVLLYAQSGAGKTSLVNARLVPGLEKEGLEVLPPGRVRGLTPPGIEPRAIKNVYSLYVILSWRQQLLDAAAEGRGRVVRDLRRLTLRRLVRMSLADFLKTVSAGKANVPRLLIFDQFEELFMLYPDRRADREGLFRQLRRALQGDRLLRALIVMREDYIAQLDPYAELLSDELPSRYRIEGLSRDAALSAIKGPWRKKRRRWARGVPERIVDNLRTMRAETSSGKFGDVMGSFVEPLYLQIVCQALWWELPQAGDVQISEQQLQAFGDTVDEVLAKFYDGCIQQVAVLGTAEEKLRGWFDAHLITPQETRASVFRDALVTGGLLNRDVDELERLHVVHTEVRYGARWCELAHDRFIGPIRKANRRRKETLAAQQTDERARVQEFLQGATAVLEEVQRLARESSVESYHQIADTALKWQLVFSSGPGWPRRMPAWSMASTTEVTRRDDVQRWFVEKAYLRSVVRKMHALLSRPDQSIHGLFGLLPSSNVEMHDDWITASLIFALEVLEGGIHLTRAGGPLTYRQLEYEWLSDVKRFKAYLLWEDSLLGEQPRQESRGPEDYYFEVCRQLRVRLASGGEHKADPAQFAPIRDYLRERYLGVDGQFDPGKAGSLELLRAKSHRIFEAGAGQGADADWHHALTYARMFYDNIITAVLGKQGNRGTLIESPPEENAPVESPPEQSVAAEITPVESAPEEIELVESTPEESSLIVLKAFQYSKAPDHRYLIINCFEAALAIYFLDPEIVKGIWKVAEGAGWQGSYSVTAVAAASWKDHWIPEELRERLSFDPATKRLVLRGVLTERQKEVLLAALPDHERDFETVIHELFKKSRLLPEETTL